MPDQPLVSNPAKKRYPQPKDMKVETVPDGVKIYRRWSFKPDDIFIGGIGLLLLILELSNRLYVSSGGLNGLEIILIIIGPILVYFSLAHRINSTRFTVGMGKIALRRGPLPWFGNRVLPSAGVVKLSLREERHRSFRSTWSLYKVVASLRNGKETVLDTCEMEEQAGFLHQELERRLSIS